jgi:hypothetical protein
VILQISNHVLTIQTGQTAAVTEGVGALKVAQQSAKAKVAEEAAKTRFNTLRFNGYSREAATAKIAEEGTVRFIQPYRTYHTPYTTHSYTTHHTFIHHTPHTIHHTPYTIHHTPHTHTGSRSSEAEATEPGNHAGEEEA